MSVRASLKLLLEAEGNYYAQQVFSYRLQKNMWVCPLHFTEIGFESGTNDTNTTCGKTIEMIGVSRCYLKKDAIPFVFRSDTQNIPFYLLFTSPPPRSQKLSTSTR